MTVFLCILAAAALLGYGRLPLKGTMTMSTAVALQAFDIVLTLGLAALALVSHLS